VTREETEIDRTRAWFVNNMAEYHVAVNADVVSVEVEMLDEKDDLLNPLGVKGIGELGIVGTSAAVANAVYHATGVRVRKTPDPDRGHPRAELNSLAIIPTQRDCRKDRGRSPCRASMPAE
jgi:CO/xanthine dehydrogenase Mo-binding subunit